MKTLAASLVALGLLAGVAHAASPAVFTDLGASAPRSAFGDLSDSAPLSPFADIQASAPRSASSGGFFTRLGHTSP